MGYTLGDGIRGYGTHDGKAGGSVSSVCVRMMRGTDPAITVRTRCASPSRSLSIKVVRYRDMVEK